MEAIDEVGLCYEYHKLEVDIEKEKAVKQC